MDINNILTVNSVPRSKLMSEILQKTGLVERSGQGGGRRSAETAGEEGKWLV